MTLADLVLLAALGVFAVFLVLDHARPNRRLPPVRFWRSRGIAVLAVSFGVSATLPLFWDEWFAAHALLDLSGLGIAGGLAVGVAVQQLVSYWWHRSLHRVPALWRWHQMHHSAERIDVYGAFYFHPLDIAGFTLVGSVSLVWITGIVAEAAVLASGITIALAFFQHSNLKTPRWIGYFVQRPESHSVHHQRGLHGYNYADLPVLDMAFGTFRNPERFTGENGFHDGASARIPEMLVGLDVSAPRLEDPYSSGTRPVVAR